MAEKNGHTEVSNTAASAFQEAATAVKEDTGSPVEFPESTRRTERRIARRARGNTRKTSELAVHFRELEEDAKQDAGDLLAAREILLMNELQPGVVTNDELAGAREDALSIPQQNPFAKTQAEALWENSEVRKEFEPKLFAREKFLAQKIKKDSTTYNTLSDMIWGDNPKETRIASLRRIVDDGERGRLAIRLMRPAESLCLMEVRGEEGEDIRIEIVRIAPGPLTYLQYLEGTSFSLRRNRSGGIVFPAQAGANDPHHIFRQSLLALYAKENRGHARIQQVAPEPAPVAAAAESDSREKSLTVREWKTLKGTASSASVLAREENAEGHVAIEKSHYQDTAKRPDHAFSKLKVELKVQDGRLFLGHYSGDVPEGKKPLLQGDVPQEGVLLSGPEPEEGTEAALVWRLFWNEVLREEAKPTKLAPKETAAPSSVELPTAESEAKAQQAFEGLREEHDTSEDFDSITQTKNRQKVTTMIRLRRDGKEGIVVTTAQGSGNNIKLIAVHSTEFELPPVGTTLPRTLDQREGLDESLRLLQRVWNMAMYESRNRNEKKEVAATTPEETSAAEPVADAEENDGQRQPVDVLAEASEITEAEAPANNASTDEDIVESGEGPQIPQVEESGDNSGADNNELAEAVGNAIGALLPSDGEGEEPTDDPTDGLPGTPPENAIVFAEDTPSDKSPGNGRKPHTNTRNNRRKSSAASGGKGGRRRGGGGRDDEDEE